MWSFEKVQAAVLLRIYGMQVMDAANVGMSAFDVDQACPPNVGMIIAKRALDSLVRDKKLLLQDNEYEISADGIVYAEALISGMHPDHDDVVSSWKSSRSKSINKSVFDDAHDTVQADDYAEASIIPASDRFVDLDHNDPSYVEAKDALSELREAVRTSNEIAVSQDDRLAFISEIESAERQLEQRRIRVAAVWLWTRAQGFLGDLSLKIRSESIHEIARRAARALLHLVGLAD